MLQVLEDAMEKRRKKLTGKAEAQKVMTLIQTV